MLPTAGVPFLHHVLAQGARRRHRPRRARDVLPARGLRGRHSATAPRSGCGSTTSPRTSRWAPAAASATSPTLLESGPDDPVVILNGDVLSGHDLAAQVATHQARRRRRDAAPHRGRGPARVRLRADRRRRAGSPRSWRRPRSRSTNRINAGCYVFRRRVIDAIPAGRPVSVERETLPGLLRRRRARARPRRRGLLARPRHAGRLRARLARPGARPPGVTRAPAGRRRALCWTAPSSPPRPRSRGGTTVGAGASVGAGARSRRSVLLDGAVVGRARGCPDRSSAVARGSAPARCSTRCRRGRRDGRRRQRAARRPTAVAGQPASADRGAVLLRRPRRWNACHPSTRPSWPWDLGPTRAAPARRGRPRLSVSPAVPCGARP